jgi:multicomponent Na+:H+ antiporter subunit D
VSVPSATLLSPSPILSIGVCLLAVLGIVLARRRPNVREGVSLLAAVANFVVVLGLRARHLAGERIEQELFSLAPGVRLAFRVDDLGLVFALVASGLWILNTLYSIGYMRAHHEHKQTRFYACFAIAIAAVMGGAFSAGLFSLFVFYEVLSLCTYPLVIHAETPEARNGAKRYLTYLLGASIGLLLPGLFVVWSLAGTLEFAAGGVLAAAGPAPATVALCLVLLVWGMAKCAILPLHGWLPAAMVAPTPVSALLHAVAVVKMGVFGVSRVVFHVIGPETLRESGAHGLLVTFAVLTILLASLIALAQDNLKRRLAYSTVSQLSYVLLGVALLTPAAATAGVVHIAVHAVSKITLFFAAGAIYVALHRTEVSQLDGIGRRMPVTMTAFAIGAISMIGLPPAAGLVSKWWLVRGAVEAGQGVVLAVIVLSALLNAAYFLPIVWRAFFRPLPEGQDTGWHEAPWPCLLALSLTALLTIALFFFPQAFLDLASSVAAGVGGPR